MIAIIDYGVGNLFSLKCSLKKIGLSAEVTADINQINSADKIILPGVGAFGDAILKLKTSGLDKVVKDQIKREKPLLGICLGMQLLFEKSYEYGEHDGLNVLKGSVNPLADSVKNLRVPHMGWNALNFTKQSPLFKYVNEGEYVYFVHSYHAENCNDSLIATSFYGKDVTAAVQSGNVFATQFHPEKSGDTGLRILKAFGEL
ncbi:MAG: imidazole glycerol phosphate synthase subunit HisH [Clostridia bacterium]|nr:imidazole glycerol phosphate synthase subunit HisH [Clostridia bacterium]